MGYHKNRGLLKVCGCKRSNWSNCKHAWQFNFQWKGGKKGGKHHRLSLDRYIGHRIESKTEAEAEAEKLRTAIREGRFGQPIPAEEMTVRQLVDVYLDRYVKSFPEVRQKAVKGAFKTICKTEIPHPTGGRLAFGDFRLRDVVADTIELFQETRRESGKGVTGTNRLLEQVRAMWSWAVKRKTKYAPSNPFREDGEPTITFGEECARSRRLVEGEERRLLAMSGPHLQARIIAAIETGMRRGEILSLQWSQIEGLVVADDGAMTWQPKARIFLPREKTKTKKDRHIPISTRLKAILEMRRFVPTPALLTDKAPRRPIAHSADAYVFGNEVGAKVDGFKGAWTTAVLKAHGEKPVFTGTANLAPACRAAFAKINLRFHDLRREAGSRWLDGGVPLHTVRDWLGHSNISQTSTYLASTIGSSDEAMRRFEERSKKSVISGQTPGVEAPQSTVETAERPWKGVEDPGPTIN